MQVYNNCVKHPGFDLRCRLVEYFREMKYAQFKEGSRSALPIVLGFIPVGIAFGVLAIKSGLSPFEAVAMSIIVYAGASQFIAVDMLASGAAALPIILTTFLVNLRHFLMSSTVSSHFKQKSMFETAIIAAELTDESFSVAMSDPVKIIGRPSFLFGLQITAQLAWVAGTALGAVFGARVNSASYGIPFALPALFICLLVLQLKNRMHIVVMLLAGALSVAFKTLLPVNWNLVLAALLASGAGIWIARDEKDELLPEEGVGPG
jgi:4-azaleucine resistance transporter AzlC